MRNLLKRITPDILLCQREEEENITKANVLSVYVQQSSARRSISVTVFRRHKITVIPKFYHYQVLSQIAPHFTHCGSQETIDSAAREPSADEEWGEGGQRLSDS